MNNQHKIPQRVILGLVFATLSMVFVNQGSEFYLKNLDKTEYFTVRQPVAVDKHNYQPCESVLVDLVRNSTITTRAVATVELILINENGEMFKKTIGGNEFNIDKSVDQVVHTSFSLPCNVKPGKYFLKAVVNYSVKGIEKNYVWQSSGFDISTQTE